MRYLVSMIIALIMSMNIAWTAPKPPKPFLAVFASADMPPSDWNRLSPDLYIRTGTWDAFPMFLEDVKTWSKGKPVVLDVQVHGSEDGCSLWCGQMNTQHFYDTVTLGYIISKIEKTVGTNVVVCLESCYGGNVYKKTIRGNKNTDSKRVVNYEGVPKFPIYGVSGAYSGWNNLVYRQYYFNTHLDFIDLRVCDKGYTPKKVDDNLGSFGNLKAHNNWVLLQSFK